MIYIPLSTETVFDVAAKLYNGDTSLGISDLLSLNPSITLTDLQGIPLNYTPGLTRTVPVIIAVTPIIAQQPAYRVGLKQSVYDLAVQLFGNAQKITDIIGNLSDLNGDISPGFTFQYTPSIDPIAILFSQRNVVVATAPVNGFFIASRRKLENGNFRLLEASGYRLLE